MAPKSIAQSQFSQLVGLVVDQKGKSWMEFLRGFIPKKKEKKKSHLKATGLFRKIKL